jgi:membrane-associated protein
MELISAFLDLVLHLDQHLIAFTAEHGRWVYLLLFVIVFCETGLVVTPFLPGDSLLFVAGTLAGTGQLDLPVLYLLFLAAAFLGDNVNYFVGRLLGKRLLEGRHGRLLKQQHLTRTQHFYEKHGPKTVILARFVPIVRTVAPFVAGVGRMRYPRYILFSVAGTLAWVTVCAGGGYLFGSVPLVKNNLSAVILGVVVLSILPGVVEILRARRRAG